VASRTRPSRRRRKVTPLPSISILNPSACRLTSRSARNSWASLPATLCFFF
jgi:hypothetical protein